MLGRLEGLVVGNSALPINHMLFVHDTLLFFKENQNVAKELNATLELYCAALGQINK
jgi:hypothetical protein